ncbi:cadherin-like domain-containing protein [Persicimonas caeni]|uniref:cadherin-like domain-containing protein n=1 Tax=Persicimonas caeni TaxID=2292766 RepID=UPI00143DB69D|nr:cadherin-like domain-containing protein [Persicimonas caeni]
MRRFRSLVALSAFVAAASWTVDASASCTTIEDFESGWPNSPWTVYDLPGTRTTTYSRSGSYGVQNPDWVYRTDVTIGQQAGERLGLWFHGSTASSGRVYLGFDADGSGAKTFIASLNTTDIRFQDNAGYNHTQLNQTSQTFNSQWYYLEVEFNGGGSVTGRLYDSDGTTLINSLTQSFSGSVVGGVVLRAFDDNVIDDVIHCTPNDAPTASNDSYGVDEDGLLDVSPSGVLANDTDPDGDALTASVVSGPSNGTLNLSANGGFTYEPAPNFHGSDSFTYRASDGDGGSDTATVNISVGSVNDAPVFTSTPVTSATEDQPYSYLVTATDVDTGDSLTISLATRPSWLGLSLGSGGSATLSGTPSNADVGPHSVEVVVRDGNGGSDTQTFTIDVQNVNDAPYFVDPTPQDGATLSVVEGDTLSFTLAGADDDGDTLTYGVDSVPTGASFDASTGAFSWTPTW